MNTNSGAVEKDLDIVAIWLRKDPSRWMAGALAGVVASVVLIIVGMILCKSAGMDMWYPVKVAALPFIGARALETQSMSGLFPGIFAIELFSVFWGVLFGHFTGTNKFFPLLGVGATWGIFTWIFWVNLYLQSFRDIYVAAIPRGPAFFVCVAWGVAFTSIAIFDRLIKGNR